MSLKGKNRYLLSYTNDCRAEKSFHYMNFEKTKSYNTNFSKSEFKGVLLRAASLKYCNFSGCTFINTEFIGTNLQGSRFIGTKFYNCVFNNIILDKTKFKNAEFINCYFFGVPINKIMGCVPIDANNNIILNHIPPQNSISNELRKVIESLRENDYIRRSNTLHLKKGKINTAAIFLLEKQYTEQQLIELLPYIPKYINNDFYTISYLEKILTKVSSHDII